MINLSQALNKETGIEPMTFRTLGGCSNHGAMKDSWPAWPYTRFKYKFVFSLRALGDQGARNPNLQAQVVQKVANAFHWTNTYPLNIVIYPIYYWQHYSLFEQPRPRFCYTCVAFMWSLFISYTFGPSITRNLYTCDVTFHQAKLAQCTALEQEQLLQSCLHCLSCGFKS